MIALAMPLLWWVSSPSRHFTVDAMQFVFWHTALETFAIVVSMLVFVTGYRAILSAQKGAVVLLGVAFLGVGLLDFLHMMSYVGMPDSFIIDLSQKSLFFWLTARFLAASALLIYIALPTLSNPSLRRKRFDLAAMLIVVGVIAYVGLFYSDHIPALFIPGYGLTLSKIISEWLIIAIHLVTLAVLWHRRKNFINECLLALTFAVLLSAISELFFTMLSVAYKDAANVLGHLYKLAAYLYLFHATFNEALHRPLKRMSVQHLRERQILNASPDGILWVDDKGDILMANPAMKVLSGYTVDELIGKNVDIFLPEHLRARHANSMRNYFTSLSSRTMGTMDLKLLRRDGQFLPVDISLGYWVDEGVNYAITYIRDLTERQKFEESLRHKATHDELTGLPNRTLLHDRLEQAMTLSERSGNYGALLLIDLDHFKTLNDTMGHDIGDLLIKQVGNRLMQCLREGDTVARQGGDEFVIILSSLSGNEIDASTGIKTASRKILDTLNQPYQFGNHLYNSTASIGATLFRGHAVSAENLMKQSDIAMYRAKDTGRNSIKFFDAEMETVVLGRVALEKELRDGITKQQFLLHYQPQVGEKGNLIGAEVLVRWKHPQRGMIAPMDFIPLAEETGLILPLGLWILESACTQIVRWSIEPEMAILTLAVNVSPRQFRQPDFVEQVLGILKKTGANPARLKLELTESMLADNLGDIIKKMSALKSVGISFSLDDFGTGYSSLSYLKRLPLDQLKIDQSFVRDVLEDTNDAAIAKTIVTLAHSLGLNVIAEGVETEGQRDFLAEHGCHVYQGYFFSRPLSLDEFEDLASPDDMVHISLPRIG